MSSLHVKTASSIHQIDDTLWNELSAGKPFQSHRWYGFGEQVMSDCRPLYLLAYKGSALVARASLWLVWNEPLPKMLGPLRRPAQRLFKRWPLLICRSPLSYSTGCVYADGQSRGDIQSAFASAAMDFASAHQASFILFDYLSADEIDAWRPSFAVVSNFESGTAMRNQWTSMDEYLLALPKKIRQHHRRVLRKAEELQIKVTCHKRAENIEDALRLVQKVERNHGALHNPWAARMLEHMPLAEGSFLTAMIGQQLVGCGLLVEDNGAQMTSVLGLESDAPYVYFMLLYETLRLAFEHNVHLLRWGSGAYDVKQRLGFSLEDNGSLAFRATNRHVHKTLQWLGKL